MPVLVGVVTIFSKIKVCRGVVFVTVCLLFKLEDLTIKSSEAFQYGRQCGFYLPCQLFIICFVCYQYPDHDFALILTRNSPVLKSCK